MTKAHFVIVIADDDPALNELISEILVDDGYEIRCCFSGDEAYRIIQRVIPDLAIIDMHMEVREAGLQVLQAMRQNPTTARISVIICSTDETLLHAKQQEIANYGAEILVKPFDISHLLETVSRLLLTAP